MPSLRSSAHRNGGPPSTPDSSIGRPTPRKITRQSTNSSPLRRTSRRFALEKELAALKTMDNDDDSNDSDGEEEEEESDDEDNAPLTQNRNGRQSAAPTTPTRASKRLRSSSSAPIPASPSISTRPTRAAKTQATKANASVIHDELGMIAASSTRPTRSARAVNTSKPKQQHEPAKAKGKGKASASTSVAKDGSGMYDEESEFAEVPPINFIEKSGQYKLFRTFVLDQQAANNADLTPFTFARGEYVFVRQPGYDPAAKARKRARQEREAAKAAMATATATANARASGSGKPQKKKNARRSTLGRVVPDPEEERHAVIDEELAVDDLIAEEDRDSQGAIANDSDNDSDSEPAPWIARIDQIRGAYDSKANVSNVFLKVTWMYTSAEQLKEIRCANIPNPYPRHEIFLSDGHTDYINAETIEDHAPVVLFDEEAMLVPCIGSTEYFFRSQVVKRGSKKKMRIEPMSPPPACCNRRFEPSIDDASQIMIYCPNDCKTWYHMEGCQPEPHIATLDEKRQLLVQGLDILEELVEEKRGKELEVGAVTNLEKVLLSK